MLSLRLEKIANKVPACKCAADIGTDHGYVPIALAKRGDVEHIIGLDIRPKPLAKAEKNVGIEGLTEKIELRLSDGAEKLKAGEANAIVISGMGGELMTEIIKAGEEVFRAADVMILSPQSELKEFRSFLLSNNYQIFDEDIVHDEGKFYFIMTVKNGASDISTYEDYELEFSKQLIERKDMNLKNYILRELQLSLGISKMLSTVESESAELKRQQCMERMQMIGRAINRY